MNESINKIIARIGALNRNLDSMRTEINAAQSELLGLLEDVQAAVQEHGEAINATIDRIDNNLRESFAKLDLGDHVLESVKKTKL